MPTISVIVPVKDRADLLERCLASLVALDYPSHRRELILVDNASREDLSSVIRQYRYADLITLYEPVPGPAAARNRGFARSSGEIIAFTDSDCVVHPQWLRELLTGFAHPAIAMVSGRTLFYGPETITSRVKERKSFAVTLEHARVTAQPLTYALTCNLAARRSVLEAVGGFATCFSAAAGEDIDLGWRVTATRRGLAIAPSALVYHARTTGNRFPHILGKMCHQGRASVLLQLRHAERVHRTPPAPLALALLGTPPLLMAAIGLRRPTLLVAPLLFLLLRFAIGYAVRAMSPTRHLLHFTAGSTMTRDIREYLVSTMMRWATDCGRLLEGVRQWTLAPLWSRVVYDDRDLRNLQAERASERWMTLAALAATLVLYVR